LCGITLDVNSNQMAAANIAGAITCRKFLANKLAE
jgi:hypothetical protein